MPRLMPIVRHRVTLLLAAIVVLVGALHLAAPILIRSYALHWLKGHGAAHARIERVRINPWLGRLTVEGLKAGDGIAVGQLAIDVDWWPLWHHRIDLRALQLRDARLNLVQQPDGTWAPAGLRLPPPSPSSGPPWPVMLHGVHLHHVRVALSGPALKVEIPIAQMALTQASASPTGAQVLNVELKLGAGRLAAGGYDAAEKSALLRGQLMLPPDAAKPGARHLAIQAKGLRLQDGRISVGIDRALAHDIRAQADGHVQAGGIELQDLEASAADGLRLGSVHQATLTDLTLGADAHLAFSRLDMQDIALPATKDHALGRMASLRASGAEIDGGLSLDTLALQGLDLSLLHDKHGLAVIDRLRAMAAPAPSPATKPPAKAPSAPAGATRLRIGTVTLDKASRISLRDAAIDPPFATRLGIESFTLKSLDSQGKAPASLDAAMRIGDSGRLTLKGSFRLHDGLKAADAQLAVRRFSMPPLSGYLERDFGNAIDTGQMDLDSRVHIQGDAIRAENRIVVRQLTLKSSPGPGKATQALGMPLGMALDMLADDRGDITLNVPVSGRLGDPNLHLSDAFNQALVSAMRSAALSSASLLLQPYGSILPALSMAADLIGQAAKPRLTPIDFAPRTAEMSDQARAYIAKIALLMQKKKDLRLQVCGVAAAGDLPAGQAPARGSAAYNQLLTLAGSRSSQIVKALTAAGVSPERLFSCLPRVDVHGKQGRAELLLD